MWDSVSDWLVNFADGNFTVAQCLYTVFCYGSAVYGVIFSLGTKDAIKYTWKGLQWTAFPVVGMLYGASIGFMVEKHREKVRLKKEESDRQWAACMKQIAKESIMEAFGANKPVAPGESQAQWSPPHQPVIPFTSCAAKAAEAAKVAEQAAKETNARCRVGDSANTGNGK